MTNSERSVNGETTEDDRTIPKLLHELGALLGIHVPWLFLARDGKGQLGIFSNQKPEQIRALAREYLKQKSGLR